ncbi:MAG: phytanoyl-CoA dioxygenase family protein [Planctomycetes bacterium]|nr:phytanoyl-CoA dioxygenase family protein [Planctomycetota bacterium]
MKDEEKYFFDLCGYIVVKEALTAEEVRRLNDAVDANIDKLNERADSLIRGANALAGTSRRKEMGELITMPSPWGETFRSLLAHPRMNPYLNVILGDGFRLDHPHLLLVQDKGCEGFHFHGSTGPGFDPNQYYIVRDGRMFNGLTVVAWQLSDVNPGDGGFALVPGSHKGNFPVPEGVRRYEMYSELIKPIVMKAGDAVVFTESVLHGTLPWNSERSRRSILARYTPGHMAYVPYRFAEVLKTIGGNLTAEERSVLEPPYHLRLNRPRIKTN